MGRERLPCAAAIKTWSKKNSPTLYLHFVYDDDDNNDNFFICPRIGVNTFLSVQQKRKTLLALWSIDEKVKTARGMESSKSDCKVAHWRAINCETFGPFHSRLDCVSIRNLLVLICSFSGFVIIGFIGLDCEKGWSKASSMDCVMEITFYHLHCERFLLTIETMKRI